MAISKFRQHDVKYGDGLKEKQGNILIQIIQEGNRYLNIDETLPYSSQKSLSTNNRPIERKNCSKKI